MKAFTDLRIGGTVVVDLVMCWVYRLTSYYSARTCRYLCEEVTFVLQPENT